MVFVYPGVISGLTCGSGDESGKYPFCSVQRFVISYTYDVILHFSVLIIVF